MSTLIMGPDYVEYRAKWLRTCGFTPQDAQV